MRVHSTAVDPDAYPDLVMIPLGTRVRTPRGMLRLLGVGPKLSRSHTDRPDGLPRHEDIVWSMFPPHWGARQYWRDPDSMERWTRSPAAPAVVGEFLRDSGGTGFWHEAYFRRGGIDAVYDDVGADRAGGIRPAGAGARPDVLHSRPGTRHSTSRTAGYYRIELLQNE